MGTYHDESGEMYTDVVYSPDGKQVAVGCRSGEVYIAYQVYLIDIESNQRTKLSLKAKHGNRVQALHWGEDGLFSLGWDNVLYRWDPQLDYPVLNAFCPCSNKEAACFTKGMLMVGIVHPNENLQVFDLSTGSLLSKSTVRANQASLSLPPEDHESEVQLLKQCRFDESLFAVTTSHNNSLKLFKFDGAALAEVYSLESLPNQILSLETSAIRKRLFFGGMQFQASLDFSLG